jgi:hypothetical protein
MRNVVPSTNCIQVIKQCQGVELDWKTGKYTKLIQGVTDPAMQCEEFGATGWKNRACMRGRRNHSSESASQAEQILQEGGGNPSDFTLSEHEWRMLWDEQNIKTMERLINTFHESQRAALNALLEVYGLKPVF